MAYGRISETFWTDTAVRRMSEDARHLELYLRSCSHRNRLGLFVLDPLYASADLQWDLKRVEIALNELEANARINWDRDNRVVFVRDTLAVEVLANFNVVKGAVKDLETVPETVLLSVLRDAVRANRRDHYDGLLEALDRRLADPEKPAPAAPDKSSTNRAASGSAKGTGNGSGTQALPTPTTPSLTPPSPSKPEGREVQTQDDDGRLEGFRHAWPELEPIVRERWHLGSDEIQVGNGRPVGMGAERMNVLELVQTYGAEETIGAILVGPQVFEFTEPTSLRWYTNKRHGPANFNHAVGQWRKDQG